MGLTERARATSAVLMRAMTSNPVAMAMLPGELRKALADLCGLVVEMAGEIEKGAKRDGS